MTSALTPSAPRSAAPAPVVHSMQPAAARAAAAIARRRRAEETMREAKIFLIDDEEKNILLYRKQLRDAGYTNLAHACDPTRAFDLLRVHQPDLVLLDLVMPKVTGLEILASLMCDAKLEHLPVLMLTDSSDIEVKQAAIDMGATDFLVKPVNPQDLLPRVRNALLNKSYRDHLAIYAQDLRKQIQERTAEIEASRREVVLCLARAAEYRDRTTGQHVVRVGRYTGVIARELGYSENQVEVLELAAQLHDIGKIGVPDEILNKPGKLTPEEFSLMRQHCAMGQHIMAPVASEKHQSLQAFTRTGAEFLEALGSPLMMFAATIAVSHHERWDGTGYPNGLKGEQIPMEGRMTAVADVFDSLSSARSYKAPFPPEKCLEIIEKGRGSHFDPLVVDAFFRRIDEILALQKVLQD